MDFVSIEVMPGTSRTGNSLIVYPEFLVDAHHEDLMIKGSSFYAVWDEEAGLWTQKEGMVKKLVDAEIYKKAEELRESMPGTTITMKLLRNYSSKKWQEWQSYVRSSPNDYNELDSSVCFANTKVKKTDYISKRLPYALEKGETPAYDELFSVLYEPTELQKLEWAIGSIIAGDSKTIQKFIVIYGKYGAGKSTFLKLVTMLFEGLYSVFDAKSLASGTDGFALADFKDNPLVAIQYDGDLSRIADNSKINSITSHETLMVNEKYKSPYPVTFNAFLFMGTNHPVKITDAKSGIIRRLIDVRPSGDKVPEERYYILMERLQYELGAIAYHCLQVYKKLGKMYYSNYIPREMIGATNDFYNFIEYNLDFFIENDPITLKTVWPKYDEYNKMAKVEFSYPMRRFSEELKNYYSVYKERYTLNGQRVRSYFEGFLADKFYYQDEEELDIEENTENYENEDRTWIKLEAQPSVFDQIGADYIAQMAEKKDERWKPKLPWDDVTTKLAEIDTSEVHFVLVPLNHIVIDFDLKGEDGKKNLELNIKAASSLPPTYCETSQSGQGLHLHYFYSGNPEELSAVLKDNVEIKVFTGKSSLRRKLYLCNNLPIATISSGLPLKEVAKKTIDEQIVKNEAHLRNIIAKNLRKDIKPSTHESIQLIKKALDDAYDRGLEYDVSGFFQPVFNFALNSTNHSKECVKMVHEMKFSSFKALDLKNEGFVARNQAEDDLFVPDEKLTFFDWEVFPNFCGVAFKKFGPDNPVIKVKNPTPEQVQELMELYLVGFNCRDYDNHVMYARSIGYSNRAVFDISDRIINKKDDTAKFANARNASYTDILSFCANKQSLKKWEIQLKLFHLENQYPWNEDLPEDKWDEIMDYCANDVVATEAVFIANKQDYTARKILVKLSRYICGKGIMNDTTNILTTNIITEGNREAWRQFIKPDLTKLFPGYIFENGVSTYRGYTIGEGGRVYAIQGNYNNVWVFDCVSQHPSSLIAENGFGPYTKNFKALLDIRVAIKHGDYDRVKEMFDGLLAEYVGSKEDAKALSYALKIAINSVYGLTAASFQNALRDPNNKDNWVAKRGALFMTELVYQLEQRGIQPIHVKTDSIKIENPSEETKKFVYEFGQKYGYTFEIENIYERFCLVNDAVYIAKCSKDEVNGKEAGEWTATGKQFQVPYVFKTLFSHEKIEIDDMCETKSTQTSLYLDFNEGLQEGQHKMKFVGKVGQFTPVIQGIGGAELLYLKDGKYCSVSEAKGVRWLESETVKQLGLEDKIDRDFYRRKVDKAIESVEKYVDLGSFVD